MSASERKITDTIPRASIEQIFGALQELARSGGQSTFEGIRLRLLSASKRRAPNTATAMWTVARDVLVEMERLKFATIGTLPRKLSDVDRLRETPCAISKAGTDIAEQYRQNPGRAYDAMLLLWLAEHPYFRRFVMRLLDSPLYIPDITNMGQLGLESVKGKVMSNIAGSLNASCQQRLEAVSWSEYKLNLLGVSINRRVAELHETFYAPDIDAKRLIDGIQNSVVLPAFLEAEGLPFDPVTFQQLLKSAQEFFCAAWTASHPRFSGRTVFQTCEFDNVSNDTLDFRATEVVHHGVSYAEPSFAKAIRAAYRVVAGTSSAYVSAYAVRAIVCVDLKLPLIVFDRCLQALIAAGAQSKLTIYTELPFEPPPQGESYIEVSGRRIGMLKINDITGESRGY